MKLYEIEQKCSFCYPSLYKQLEADSMLDVGDYGANWFISIFPKLKDNPTLLLHSYDFELISVNAVSESISEMLNPNNYRQLKACDFKLIPFGQSGSGDLYCFLIANQHESESENGISIVYVWHDCNQIDYLSKNSQDFMFKSILTMMAQKNYYESMQDEEFILNIKNTLKTHGKYLIKPQEKILNEIILRNVMDYEVNHETYVETMRGLLNNVELNRIIFDNSWFAKINDTIDEPFLYL